MRGQSALTTVVSVTATQPATLLQPKVNRAGAIIYNETGTLCVLLGPGTVSASYYSFRMTATSKELIDNYTGIVTAIKLSGTTNAMVTEIW